MEIGKQYGEDDEFKRKARLHQSKYRAEILKVDCAKDECGNMLKTEDAENGLNFYPDLNILQAVKNRYGIGYRKQLYSNLLRSEHIPFNFFIPLREDKKYAAKVFNEFAKGTIKEIMEIKIEYAPEPKGRFLNDKTSFDSYVEYVHVDNQKGILGIEVKYTEKSYPLGKEEKIKVDNAQSKYYEVTRKTGLFIQGAEKDLKRDKYRQIWRNQILGESIKQNGETTHFTSLLFFPFGNKHFQHVLPEYFKLLNSQGRDRLIDITYEDFFAALKAHSPGARFDNWITYLEKRYIVQS
jgi:hypothetical protein